MLRNEIHAELLKMPIIDVHSHLNRDHIAAVDLDQLMFYHMLMYPLRSVGATEDKMWPEEQAKAKGLPYDEWFVHWPKIQNTGFAWILKTIMRDLYGFEGPYVADQLPRIRKLFAEKQSQPDWPRQILQKANIARIYSSQIEVKPLAPGAWDGNIRFTIESFPTSGTHENLPWKRRLELMSPLIGKDVATVQRLRDAVSRFYDRYDWSDKHALVAWVSSAADFAPVSDAAIDSLLAAALADKELSAAQVAALEGAYIRAMCQAIRGRTGTFQLCYGVQYLTPEPLYSHPAPRSAPQFASSFGHLLGEFPDIHFDMLNGFEADEPVWCGLTQAYGNISLANFWWKTFFPSVIHDAVSRRLHMVPLGRLIGFFSDGWCAEYVYGRLRMVQRCWANVLAEKVEQGWYTADEAVDIARKAFFDTPKELFAPGEIIKAG